MTEPEYPPCGSKLRNKPGSCRRPAGWGTSHPGTGTCKLHGGSTRSHVARAQQEAAREACATYGLPVDGDPGEILLEEEARTNGHVKWLAAFIRQQDPKALVWMVTEETARGSGQFPGVDVRRSAAPSVWLELYQKERRHLVEVSRTIIVLGLEERRQRLREQELTLALQLIYGTVRELGHRPDDPVVRAVVLRQVQAMQGDVIEGVVAA
jgi:hypothetical protein